MTEGPANPYADAYREASGMTRREQGLSARDLHPSIHAEAKSAAETLQDGRWLLVWGVPGSGKTWLSCALLNRAIDDGARARMVHWLSELGAIRATYHPRSDETERMILRRLQEARLLLLDDLGSTGEDTQHSRRLLLLLIHERDRHDRQTIITSNLPPDRLYGQLDQRTVSRLRARCAVVEMPARDLRGLRCVR